MRKMRPCKNFSLVLPFEKYRELRKLSIDIQKPISELIREGINIILKTKDAQKTSLGN